MDTSNQQASVTEPMVNTAQKSSRFSFVYTSLIIILCFVALGSTVYMLTIINSQQNTIDHLAKILVASSKNALKPLSVTPTPSPLPEDPMLYWNTYISTRSAFSIKYPTDWRAKNTPQQDPKILEYVVFNPKEATNAAQISITLTYGTRTYQEVLNLDPQVGEKITVASVSGIRKIKKDSGGNVAITIAIPVKTTQTIILFGKEMYKDIFNQMLSTFKLSK